MHLRTFLLWAAASIVASLQDAQDAFAEAYRDSDESYESRAKIAVGDWQLSPSLQLRTFADYRNQSVHDSSGDQSGLFERSRVSLGAEYETLRAKVTLQDARGWGSSASFWGFGAPISANATGAYEAFAELRSSASRPAFVRLGRQVISWGEGRLLGESDWSPLGRSLDAIRARYSTTNWDFEIFGALLQPNMASTALSPESTSTHVRGELVGAQAAFAFDPRLRIELSGLARFTHFPGLGVDSSALSAARNDGALYVVSLRIHGDGGQWRYSIEGAYEAGHITATSQLIAAYAASGHVARTFEWVLLSPTLKLGGSYASGGDASSKGTMTQFDPVLPDVRTWHGRMNLFAWSNQLSADTSVSLELWDNVSTALGYRYARLVQANGEWLSSALLVTGVSSLAAPHGSELGHEIDVDASWLVSRAFELKAGYGVFVIGEGARAILSTVGSGQDAMHSGYLRATLNFQ